MSKLIEDVTELRELVATSDSAGPLRVMVASLVGFSSAGLPLVELQAPHGTMRLEARSCVPLGDEDLLKDVLLAVDETDYATVIVTGVVLSPVSRRDVEVVVQGQSIAMRSEESIILRCGEASIALHRDGKIVVRGKHVVSHASGVNRIRGAAVELN